MSKLTQDSPKFPQAYDRFEKSGVDVEDIKTFQQLLTQFGQWAKKRFISSKKQRKALAIEGKNRHGIEPVMKTHYIQKAQTITYTIKKGKNKGKTVSYERKRKAVTAWRNIITGAYAKAPEDGG